jgi:hypothetical protein
MRVQQVLDFDAFLQQDGEILLEQKARNKVILVLDDILNYNLHSPDLVISKCAVNS